MLNIRYYAGIDPDLRKLSYAIVNSRGQLVRVQLAKINDKDLKGLPLVERACRKAAHLGSDVSLAFTAAAIEMPDVTYTGRTNAARRQDLVLLAAVAGAWKGSIPNSHLTLPFDWKGTVPKHIPQCRAYRDLGIEYELWGGQHKYAVPKLPKEVIVSDGINPGDWADVSDSVALALWCYRKFGGGE